MDRPSTDRWLILGFRGLWRPAREEYKMYLSLEPQRSSTPESARETLEINSIQFMSPLFKGFGKCNLQEYTA